MAAETRIARALVLLVVILSMVRGDDLDELCGFFFDIPTVVWPPGGVPGPDSFEGMEWAERPLIPAPHREDLCMGAYNIDNQPQVQSIFMMEERTDERVTVAQLNYDGDPIPVVSIMSGSAVLLQAQIVRFPEHGNYWFLTVNGRQDYEMLDSPIFFLQITIPGVSFVATAQITIINIDDNAPVIHVFDNCEAEELGEPRITDCVYEVTDADGEISTRFMSFQINSARGDEDIFAIRQNNIENDWFRMTMTIEIIQPLDFVVSAFHIFQVTAEDSLPNSHTASIMVEVENVESRPPRWIEIWTMQRFDEKSAQTYSVLAIDGDTGIDEPICYRLNNSMEYPFFSIETLDEGRGGGSFHVTPIDRDELQMEVFQLGIIAYKCDNDVFNTEMAIVIIVDDINDNIPEPLHDVYTTSIREETPTTLSFENEFGFHDKDLGLNAQYTVHLENVQPAGVAEAFYIAPATGYQRQTFIIGTIDHAMLDYEIPEFQHIILKVVATELVNPEHIGEAIVNVHLINWNDELPAFDTPSVEVSFNETEGAGYEVATMLASDRDIGDWISFTLLGNAVNFLEIDELTGVVTVTEDDAFDYHQQSELVVQVQAQDNFDDPSINTVTSQLIIRLNDINNTPPTLRLPRRSPDVEENVPEGFIITREITASDPDTTSDLEFEIIWETSYATKQGREAIADEYHGCVKITTIPHETDPRSVIGQLEVLTIRDGVTIDYEEFEILYLTVRVVDKNTEIGDDYDELTLALIIIDLNDNPPIWDNATLITEFRVRETSATGFVIGSVLARDIDGPLYNQITYSIHPRSDTPPNLVRIDPVTGQLSVDADEAIDADVPPRYFLYYTVSATDRCMEEDCPPDPDYWTTYGEIEIEIMDRNNRIPQPQFTQRMVEVYENETTGYEIIEIIATDLDRDVVHHRLNYQINFLVNARLRDFFAINPSTGLLTVNYETDAVLDRDRGEPEHQMFIVIMDNLLFEGDGNRNQAEEVEIRIVLLDINDNAPELPPRDTLRWIASEGLLQGVRLVPPDIYAPDIDEPGSDNSRVAYEILSLTILDREDVDIPELFAIITIDYETGELETAMPLRGYWGTYDIRIKAYDHGIPVQYTIEDYELVIRPYNFHAPEFVFPQDGTTLRLARERASVNVPLTLVNGDTLSTIEATDEDGLEAGIVDFSIAGNDEADQYFSVGADGTLILTTELGSSVTREFQVTIRATDRGTEPGSLFTDSTITIMFVPIQADPFFSVTTATVAIMENEGGLDERHQLPLATDHKNYHCTDDCHDLYYHIVGGNGDGLFAVDPLTNVLYLVYELNRNENDQHVLTIAATNSPTAPTTAPTDVLTVTVNVREENPRPIFVSSLYTAGIYPTDTINRNLFTVQATHSEGRPITYHILWETMNVDDPSLTSVAGSAFRLDSATGDLFLNMQPSTIMQGMFEFQVEARDGVETDRAECKVFLISTQNRVFFIFVNTLDTIQDNSDFIAQTFTVGFGMTCNIDDILPSSGPDGTALTDRTEVRAHFIQDDVPVPAIQIEQLRNDIQLINSIQLTLSTMLLVLEDFVTDFTPEAGADMTQIMLYVLAALSILLALLLIVSLLTCCIRTRTLNRRLAALSTTKFGSMESQLNRAGVIVPGTNKHAVEGSNPVWNEQINAPDFDALSNDSGDSDFTGVEDLPQFAYGKLNEDNETSNSNAVASHRNNFGFNTSPFSPEFSNSNRHLQM